MSWTDEGGDTRPALLILMIIVGGIMMMNLMLAVVISDMRSDIKYLNLRNGQTQERFEHLSNCLVDNHRGYAYRNEFCP
jgi:hypothetical protein